jgi:hypothetical protein
MSKEGPQMTESEPTWAPPYENFSAEHEAQVAWLNFYPDQVPPWADVARDVADAADRATMPEEAPARVEPPRMPIEPRTPATPRPAVPSAVSPTPPSPIGIGKRCRVLVGPPLHGGNRGHCRDGKCVGWDGVALSILLDGDSKPKRYVEGRVSELHDYWTDMPLTPANVTWMWGDPTPQLAPPVLEPSDATTTAQPPIPQEGEGFNRKPETTDLPPLPRRYPGMLG